MLKILHLTSVHQPFDPRITKECNALKDDGYDVTLVVPHSKDESIDGIKIKAVEFPKNRFMRMTHTTYKIFKIAKNEAADLYHFHDPELMILGLFLKLLGKKVVYDVHEDVPNQILEKKWLGPYPLRKLFSSVVKCIEYMVGLIIDGIVTVTPDIEKRFPSSKTILLRNYVHLSFIDKITPATVEKNNAVIIYNGTISRARGIKEMLQSVGRLNGKAQLWILGKWDDSELWNECNRMQEWQHARYFGLKRTAATYSYLKVANVGLHILYNLPHYKGGFATKAFEYMACSIPFIVTDNPRNRESYGDCALYVNPMDVNDITEKMIKLLNNEKIRKEMGQRGRHLAETQYSWEIESKKLIDLYKYILM